MTLEAHPLVEFIRRDPGMTVRILDAHVDDGAGRCVVCSRSDRAGRTPWPCTLQRCVAAATVVCVVDGFGAVVSGPGRVERDRRSEGHP